MGAQAIHAARLARRKLERERERAAASSSAVRLPAQAVVEPERMTV